MPQCSSNRCQYTSCRQNDCCQVNDHLSEFEREALAGMLVRFMVYHLRHDTDLQEIGQFTLQAWLNMSLYFFRVDDVPNAGERLMQLIGQMHSEK